MAASHHPALRMPRRRMASMLLLLAGAVEATPSCRSSASDSVQISFEGATVQLTNADGQVVETPFLEGGSARYIGIGSRGGQVFDLVITPLYGSQQYTYVPPDRGAPANAYAGFGLLTFGIAQTICTDNGVLNLTEPVGQDSVQCFPNPETGDESYMIPGGMEFRFSLVQTGTSIPMAPFDELFLVMYDMDGAERSSGKLYELVAVYEASETIIAPSARIEAGSFEDPDAPDGNIQYAIAQTAEGVDWPESYAEPGEEALAAIAEFELLGYSEFTVLLSAVSTVDPDVEPTVSRSFMFSMSSVQLGAPCPPPASPPEPLSPPPPSPPPSP